MITLSQVLKNFQTAKNNGTMPLEAIPLSNFQPVVFKNGVSVIKSENRKSSAQFATFLATQFIESKKGRVLHVTLEEFFEDTSLNYLALLSHEKVRHLKGPNFNFDKVAKYVSQVDSKVKFVSLKSDDSIMSQITNLQALMKEFDLIVFEGVDKALSTDKREVLFNQLLTLLHNEAQETGVSVLIAAKEERFKVREEIKEFSLKGSGTNLSLNEEEIEKIIDYNTYALNFNKSEISKLLSQKEKFFFGFNKNKPVLIDSHFSPGSFYHGEAGSGKSSALSVSIKMNLLANSSNTAYIINEAESLKSISNLSNVISLDSSSLINSIYQEVLARREVFTQQRSANLEEYEKSQFKIDPNFKGLARIVAVIDNFEKIGYEFDTKKDSLCYRLGYVVRMGRACGITLHIAANGRVPEYIYSALATEMVFKADHPGRYYREKEYGQFPLIKEEDFSDLIKSHYEPLKAEALTDILKK